MKPGTLASQATINDAKVANLLCCIVAQVDQQSYS